jgi:hypothetical protein
VQEWSDATDILKGSFSQRSGYRDGFYNRVVVYFDYDESGNDKAENFESAVIALDAGSQSPGLWDEASTKTIKSKWIRSRTYARTANITWRHGLSCFQGERDRRRHSATTRAANTPAGPAPEARKEKW